MKRSPASFATGFLIFRDTSGNAWIVRTTFQCPSYSVRYRNPLYGLNSRYSDQEYGTPPTRISRTWNPIASKTPCENLPRLPSGMSGRYRSFAWNSWMTRRFGSFASITDRHCTHTTVRVCSNPRNVNAAPQFGQLKPLT